MTPRGERNSNPCNLRPDKRWKWDGETGADAGGYIVFDTSEHGLRAGAKDIFNQQLLHGLRTIADILEKFAPERDRNDVAAYIGAVSRDMGRSPLRALDLREPDVLASFLRAVIRHENGRMSYSDAQIGEAVAEALGKKEPGR